MQMGNIQAGKAVADVIRTCLGPRAMLKMLIDTAKKNNVKVGICGQGPSDFPDFAQFLVDLGIDSISVTPDSLVKTVKAIYEVEKK